MKLGLLISISIVSLSLYSAAQKGDPKATEVWTPEPKIVVPGTLVFDAPSDAVILFNGKNLDKWSVSDTLSKPAKWTINADGSMTVKKGTGTIQTKKNFLDFQLHLEYLIPENITGSGQVRGNSGIFLSSPKKGDYGYEIQILDNYNNKTYVNGQVGSVYKQSIPLANACKKPGEWQTYDIIWTAPRFHTNGKLKNPGRVTVFHNAVLVQNNYTLKGTTPYIGKPVYKKHGAAPIKLQDHDDPSEPISYRNIWLREL